MRDVAMRENSPARRQRHGACEAMGAGVAAKPRARTHARYRSRHRGAGQGCPRNAAMPRCSSLMYVKYTSLLAPCLAALRGQRSDRISVNRP